MWYLPHSPCQNWLALVKPNKPSCFALRKRRSCGTPSTDVLRLPKTVYLIGNLKTLECFFEIWLHPWFWEMYVVYSILWKCFSSVCKSTRAYFRRSSIRRNIHWSYIVDVIYTHGIENGFCNLCRSLVRWRFSYRVTMVSRFLMQSSSFVGVRTHYWLHQHVSSISISPMGCSTLLPHNAIPHLFSYAVLAWLVLLPHCMQSVCKTRWSLVKHGTLTCSSPMQGSQVICLVFLVCSSSQDYTTRAE